jgi:phosphoribosylglycinamide formyltransferase-1
MKGVILISGNGSNLQAIIDNAKQIKLDIQAVISDNSEAYGLKRAKMANITTQIIQRENFSSRAEFDADLAKIIDLHQPEIIILAGFMQILSAEFTQKYAGKMLNIHPSLLPKFQGLNTHQRALDAGEKRHGVSIHFVNSTVDGGAIISQSSVKIRQNDTSESLAKRVLTQEHLLFPKVIHWFTQGRLKLDGNSATLDGKNL